MELDVVWSRNQVIISSKLQGASIEHGDVTHGIVVAETTLLTGSIGG